MLQKSLEDRSLTELRAIAQGCGASFDFSTSKAHLLQAIRIKSVDIVPKPDAKPVHIAEPERIRTIPPSKNVSRETLILILKPFTDRGLKIEFDGDNWTMRAGKKEDSGNMRVPLRILVRCAEQLLR